MGLLKFFGIETRSSFTQSVIDLLQRDSLGLNPKAETPAIDFVCRSFSTAEGATATFSPAILAEIARNLLTKRRGFVGLIEIIEGELVIRASTHAELSRRRWQLTFEGRSLTGVEEAQVFHVQYSGKGSPLQTNPELCRLHSLLLRSLADEAGGPVGSIVALGSREVTDTKGPKKSVSERLRNLRGGLATFLSPPSGSGGGQGASVFQPRPWSITRLGANPPDALVTLIKQIDLQMATALGVPATLINGGGTALRESMRIFISTTLRPLAKLVEFEAAQKLNQQFQLKFPSLVASDIASRARAFKALREAGLEAGEAKRIVGFEE